MMLIQRNSSGIYGTVPVRLHRYSKEARFVLVGDEESTLIISGQEIEELYSLLEPFVSGHADKTKP